MYDDLLRLTIPDRYWSIGFADYITIVATAKSTELLELLTNGQSDELVVRWKKIA